MKNQLVVFGSALAIMFTACTKEIEVGIQLQEHDKNRMMDTLHVMIGKMQVMTMTKDPEVDLSSMIILHNEGAISMANVELQAGSNDSLKQFAQKVITDQQNEIMEFQSIAAALTVDNVDMEYMQEQKNNIEKMDKTADVQLLTGNIDNDFATLMIVHHQAAIDHASGYLHHGNYTELKAMANDIVTARTREINRLADWLKANKR